MTDALDPALTWIRHAEGADGEITRDAGGVTRWGISQRAYPDLDIEDLTWDHAAELYTRDYWRGTGCHLLADDGAAARPRLAIAVCDGAVNQGPGTAVRLLQQALGVKVDGILGPRTAEAAREARGGIMTEYLSYRAQHYAELVAADSRHSAYLRGWLARLFRLQRYLLLQVPA